MPRLVPCPSCQRHVFPQETTCPHCGRTSPAAGKLAALVVTAGLALAACDRPVASVYGPPPVDPSQRDMPDPQVAPSASGAQPAPSASATSTDQDDPVRPPVDVYGPPPRDPDQRDTP